jgi:hypothetical protein
MEIENDIEVKGDRLLDDLIQERDPLAGVPIALALKNDRIYGNTNVIESELVDVLQISRSRSCPELLKRVVSTLGKPSAQGNTMLQMMKSLPHNGVGLSCGE